MPFDNAYVANTTSGQCQRYREYEISPPTTDGRALRIAFTSDDLFEQAKMSRAPRTEGSRSSREMEWTL